MNAIRDLEQRYFQIKFGLGKPSACIDWAIDRLQANEEGEDQDIVLLAAATEATDALPLTEKILAKYLGYQALNEQLAAGKYVAELRKDFLAGKVSIEMLDSIFTKLYYRLDYPTWLTMLSRNCEYATDIPAFREPFEKEFEYITNLWEKSPTLEEFMRIYDKKISKTHDV